MLAREYFEAAQAVTLATKPVLLYYSIMNLALAEVLLKQSGGSSLDAARQQHRHHGLTTSVGGHNTTDCWQDVCKGLRAKPMLRDATCERFGTFELWHQSARHVPWVGKSISKKDGTSGVRVMTASEDNRLPLLPAAGVDLLYCAQHLPVLSNTLASLGASQKLLRGAAAQVVFDDVHWQTTHVVHPCQNQALMHQLLARFEYAPSMVPMVDVDYSEKGGATVRVKHFEGRRFVNSLPDAFTENAKRLHFLSENVPLNEFGFFYVALFIVGNYARYFPDKWIKDIEASSPLCLLVEEMVHQGAWRIPLLSLSEMQRSFIVPDNDHV